MTPIHPNPGLAIAFMLLATVFVAATMILAKSLGTDALGTPLHALQVRHGRFLFAFLGIIAATLVLRPQFSQPNIRLHVLRASFGWVGVTLMFASVAFIPISDATAITFLNPIFAMALAIPILGERVGPIRWVAAAIALTGAMILLRPGPGTFQTAALLSLTAAFCFGVEITCIKRLSAREGPVQILLINNALGLSLATVAVQFVWQSPTGAQWAGLIALGLLMAAAQTCYINALARAETGLVVPFSYATLVFAVIYDFAIFRVLPDTVSIIGACVIIAGAALLAWREALHGRRSSRLARKGLD